MTVAQIIICVIFIIFGIFLKTIGIIEDGEDVIYFIVICVAIAALVIYTHNPSVAKAINDLLDTKII